MEDNSTDSLSVRKQFESPAKKYRPMVRWWWPGDDVTDAELRREIDALDNAGFGGAEIQAFFKGFDAREFSESELQRMRGFASASFFRHLGVAVEEARAHGLFIDYTFGSGWPFGGGDAITPELASIELRSTHRSVQGPAHLRERLEMPAVTDGDPLNGADVLKSLPNGWADRLKKRTKLVAIVAVRGRDAIRDFSRPASALAPGDLEAGTSIDLTSRMGPDGVLDWDVPPGTWQVFVFCSLPTVQRVNGASGTGPQLVLDHMSSEAFAAHAKRVGDAAIPFLGKFFGNGLRAVFCDSLEVRANLFWSEDFLAEFRRRRGYDLVPYLPILKVQSQSEPYGEFYDIPVFEMSRIGAQVRHDYRQTVSDLMCERFYGRFNQWAHEHNLLSRTQAHGAPADVLRIYGAADIPETEDLYDRGGYDFLKLAASAAHVTGHSIVGSESFVWPGSLYEITPEKMKMAADELLTAGVNAIVYHGFAYRMQGLAAPGWHPFSGINDSGNYSSQCNELNPFWPYFAQLNSYITRLQYLSQAGTNVAPVALYCDDLAHGAEEQPPAPKLNQALMDAGFNYDHINTDVLLRSRLSDKKLQTQGGALYQALVVPALEAMDAALAERIESSAAAGLPVLFAGQVPSSANGLFKNAQQSRRVQAALYRMQSLQNAHVCDTHEQLLSKLEQAAKPNIRFRSRSLPFIQKRIGRLNVYFLRNMSDAVEHLQAEFEAVGNPELWDPWTGKTAALTAFRRGGDWVELHVDLQPLSSALIVFDAEVATPPVSIQTVSRLIRTQEIGATGWKFAATGLMPSGKQATVRRDLPLLIDWSLDSELRGFSGKGTYATTFSVSAPDGGSRLVLDLGEVKDVAEVTVNGKLVGALLLRPYQIEITEFVHPGDNRLEVAVTNTLFNSMVLRERRPFRPGGTENPSGLMSAGLIGPVQMNVTD